MLVKLYELLYIQHQQQRTIRLCTEQKGGNHQKQQTMMKRMQTGTCNSLQRCQGLNRMFKTIQRS
jgi:hypothetical protein